MTIENRVPAFADNLSESLIESVGISPSSPVAQELYDTFPHDLSQQEVAVLDSNIQRHARAQGDDAWLGLVRLSERQTRKVSRGALDWLAQTAMHKSDMATVESVKAHLRTMGLAGRARASALTFGQKVDQIL